MNHSHTDTAHSGQLEDLNSLVPVIYNHAIKAEDTVCWMIFRLRGGQSSHVPGPLVENGIMMSHAAGCVNGNAGKKRVVTRVPYL